MCDCCDCRSRPRISQLWADHERISSLSAALRARIESDDADGAAIATRELAAALDPHSRVEEAGLYVELGSIGCEAGDLEAKHERVDRAVEAAAVGNADFAEVIDALDVLARHICTEEYDLFPAAHQLGAGNEEAAGG